MIGLLKFACYVIVSRRAFLRRLINFTIGVSKPDHKICLNKHVRLDLNAKTEFMDNFNLGSIFRDEVWKDSEKLQKYTDAAGSLGYGAVFGSKLFYGKCVDINMQEFSITVKELFPIVVAIEIWGQNVSNSSIMFFLDNLAVVHINNVFKRFSGYIIRHT